MKWVRHCTGVSVATVLTLLAMNTPGFADDTSQQLRDLQDRQSRLEEKLDRVLELLGERKTSKSDARKIATSGNQTTVSTDQQPVADDEGGDNAGLKLKLYLMEESDIKAVPPTAKPSVASRDVQVPSTFSWGAFIDVPSMARYQAELASVQPRHQAALEWTGVLNVRDAGETQFVLAQVVGERAFAGACASVLRIDDQDVLRLDAAGPRYGSNDKRPRQASNYGSVNLEKGPHEFALWVYCVAGWEGRQASHAAVYFTLDKKGPSDENPVPLSSQDLSLPD